MAGKMIWGHYYQSGEKDNSNSNKTDKRILPTDDIVSKCGADNPETECSFYYESKTLQGCGHHRFGIMCDRLLTIKEKETPK